MLVYAYAVADVVAGTITLTWIRRAQRELPRRVGRSLPLTRITTAAAFSWTAIFFPLTAIGMLIVWFVFPVLFGSDYALTWEQAVALAITIVLLPLPNFFGISTLVSNQYVHSLVFSVAASLASVIASLLLVTPFGIAGAVWAIAIANAVRAIAAFAVLAIGERRRELGGVGA